LEALLTFVKGVPANAATVVIVQSRDVPAAYQATSSIFLQIVVNQSVLMAFSNPLGPAFSVHLDAQSVWELALDNAHSVIAPTYFLMEHAWIYVLTDTSIN
jgi:hypothetical protein